MSRVSVIIPCLNGETTLQRAIESCTSEDHEVRVLVFDDGSRDRSVDLARQLGVEVIRGINTRGQCKARNIPIRTVYPTTDYIQFLDCDDWLEPGKIDAHAAKLADSGADVTWGPLHIIGPGNDEIIPQNSIQHAFIDTMTCPQTNSMFFKKEVLYGRPWPEELGTEYVGGTPYFWKRMLKRNVSYIYSPEGVAVYNIGNPNSLSRTRPTYLSSDPAWPSP